MTSRQRVHGALAHQQTDRVPRLLYEEAIGYTPAVGNLLKRHCGPSTPLDFFGMDLTRVLPAPTRLRRDRFARWLGDDSETALAGDQVDEWGVWRRPGDFHHFARIEPPLHGLRLRSELNSYPWPDLDAPYRFEAVGKEIAALHARGLAVVGYAGSIFERAWYLRGFESLMTDMLTDPGLAHALIERTAWLQKCVASEFARLGVDIVLVGDDIAGQTAMLTSLPTWREFLKNRLASTIAAVKTANPGTFFCYHSDGNVEAVVPELIEIGVDILNPVQPECVDPAALKRLYGDRLCFWGTVSVQRTMSFGTPEQVRSEVGKRVCEVGADGGLILSPAHVLAPEVPWGNITAFFQAADQTITP